MAVICRVFSFLVLLTAGSAVAAELRVAVAANFAAPMKQLVTRFEATSGHRARLSFGSTGKLYAQIINGAPFDVLLAADAATPARLVAEGAAVPASLATYAIGRLALWSADAALINDGPEVLGRSRFRHLAVANPKLAPYGAAAAQTLQAMGLTTALQPRLVIGESIGQTYQFVASGNAQLGFVALAQVQREGRLRAGSVWLVPESMHDPLRQDAVILTRSAGKPAASALLAYLRSGDASAVMRQFGYRTPR